MGGWIEKTLSVSGSMPEAPPTSSRALPAIVRELGWVSFFTDAASDMIYPLLPAFLVSLGAGAQALGMVEGVAEATSALVKVVAGRLSDRTPARKPFVVLGYGIATFVRPLLAFVVAPWQVVLVRATDRVGKGLRSAPRDALVAGAVPPAHRGLAYGFHRMMDNLGAVLGPLLAFVFARGFGLSPRAIFACAIVPGLFAMATLVLGVREAPREPAAKAPGPASAPREKLAPAVKSYLLVVAIFTLGASADSFLLLRLLDLGLPVAWAPVVWLTLNGSKAATNMPGGRLSDRLGRKKTLVIAWLVYGAAYAAFPLTQSVALTWALIVGYGVYYGLAEGGEKAILADLAPADQRGRAFGALHALTGIAVLPANTVFGFLYERNPSYAFGVGAGCALVAAALLGLQGQRRLGPSEPRAAR
jgi:MFS family permease